MTSGRLGVHGLIVLSGVGYALSAPFASAPQAVELVGIVGRKLVWFACMVPIFMVCLRYFWETRAEGRALLPLRKACVGLWVVPVLLVLWGMSPYLGLRTTPVFSMFSNLRTEGETSNHMLLASNPLKIFDYQEDWVVVKPTASPLLRHLTRDAPINYLEFKRLVKIRAQRREGPIGIAYERRGERIEIEDVKNDPELMADEPLWSRKFLSFRRPLYWEERARCPW